MSELFSGGCKYENVKRNAFWYNAHLDSRLNITHDCIDDVIKHLNDCEQNPTVGLIARRKYRSNNYLDCYERNLKDISKFKSVETANNAFKEKLSILYPKTMKARKFLIESNRVVFESVKPIKKNLRRALFKILG